MATNTIISAVFQRKKTYSHLITAVVDVTVAFFQFAAFDVSHLRGDASRKRKVFFQNYLFFVFICIHSLASLLSQQKNHENCEMLHWDETIKIK